MRRIRGFLRGLWGGLGPALCLLAAICAWFALKYYMETRPAEQYLDQGVKVFTPWKLEPTAVENTGGSYQYRRRNPTKIVYRVYYKATDGSGYRWHVDERLEGKELVERRVLSVLNEDGSRAGTYITVAPEETAESYVAGCKARYTWIFGLSTGFLLLCGTVWAIGRIRRQQEAVKDL